MYRVRAHSANMYFSNYVDLRNLNFFRNPLHEIGAYCWQLGAAPSPTRKRIFARTQQRRYQLGGEAKSYLGEIRLNHLIFASNRDVSHALHIQILILFFFAMHERLLVPSSIVSVPAIYVNKRKQIFACCARYNTMTNRLGLGLGSIYASAYRCNCTPFGAELNSTCGFSFNCV